MNPYGDRDAFSPGQRAIASDGREFVQGDTSTYLKVTLPPQSRPVGYRQDYGHRRSERTEFGRIVHTGYGGFRVVDRVESVLYWLVTYESPDGDRYTIRKLKASREGNG